MERALPLYGGAHDRGSSIRKKPPRQLRPLVACSSISKIARADAIFLAALEYLDSLDTSIDAGPRVGDQEASGCQAFQPDGNWPRRLAVSPESLTYTA